MTCCSLSRSTRFRIDLVVRFTLRNRAPSPWQPPECSGLQTREKARRRFLLEQERPMIPNIHQVA